MVLFSAHDNMEGYPSSLSPDAEILPLQADCGNPDVLQGNALITESDQICGLQGPIRRYSLNG
mgnify:CR=1 FL=1